MTVLLTDYARSLGVTEADAHTARNIHLSVADCRHLQRMLRLVAQADEHGDVDLALHARQWNQELSEYLKGAV